MINKQQTTYPPDSGKTARLKVEENALIITLPQACTLQALEDLQKDILAAIDRQYAPYHLLIELLTAILNKKQRMRDEQH